MTAPPYPLASAPGVHVFLVTSEDGHTHCEFATASRHKAAAEWERLHHLRERLRVTAWHGDTVLHATWTTETWCPPGTWCGGYAECLGHDVPPGWHVLTCIEGVTCPRREVTP